MKSQHKFESFEAFLAAAVVPPQASQSQISSRNVGREEFLGTKTFDEAVSLARSGWAEGAAKVAAIRAELDEFVGACKLAAVKRFAYDVTGDYVDVGRVLAGEVECFGTENDSDSGRPQGRDRIVRLFANLGVSAAVSQAAILARGAVVLAAVDVLEAIGIRVELWACVGSSGSRGTYQCDVLVKEASQPVDVDRLAFLFCHRATLRRLFFSHKEQHRFFPKQCQPHGIEAEEGGIVTPEAKRAHSHTRKELVEEVATLCKACGIVFPDEIQV